MRYISLLFAFFTFNLSPSFSQQADSIVVEHCYYGDDGPVGPGYPHQSKSFTGYDSLGVLLFEFYLEKETIFDSLQISDSTRYSYDSQGRLTSVYDFIFPTFPIYTPKQRINYTYNSLNQVTNYLEENWDIPTSSWTISKDIFYQPSGSGTIDSSRTFTATTGNATSTFFDSISNVSISTSWKLDSGNWNPHYRSTIWKDTAGNDTLRLSEIGAGTTFKNYIKYEFFYNASGKLVEERRSFWDSTAWIFTEVNTSIYDTNDLLDTLIRRIWNGTALENYTRTIYDQDSTGRSVFIQQDYWIIDSSSFWEPHYLIKNEFSPTDDWKIFYSFFWDKHLAVWDTSNFNLDSLDALSRIYYGYQKDFNSGSYSVSRDYFDSFGNNILSVTDGSEYHSINKTNFNSQNHKTYYFLETHSRINDYYKECFYYRSPHYNSGFVIDLPDSTGICLSEVKNLNTSVLYSNSSLTFSWSPSAGLSSDTILSPDFAPVTSTIYTLTVTDGLGHNTDILLPFNVITPPPPVQIDSVILSGHCFPDTILFFTASQAQYQYEWINTITGNKIKNDTLFYSGNGTSDSFFLNVIDFAGCMATSDTVSVMMNPGVNCKFYTAPSYFCSDDTIILNAYPQLASYVYQWEKDSTAFAGAIQSSRQTNQSGYYTLITLDTITQCSSVYNEQIEFLEVNPP
ncbi:MAG TPA: hypothetical protein PKJ62_01440, partial [Bacteroidia bacterium]|nr:hypothetical protein [Bacteroidia bacterium]